MEISVVCTDASGALITGAAASTALKIRRVSDGFLLDWADLTFKADPGTLTTAMDEVDATHLAGEYRKVVVITAWTDGFYQALVHFDDATTVLNFDGKQYVQGGREVEVNLDAAVTTRMATFTYTAPDNTNIGLIKTQTDKLAFTVTNQVDANVIDWKSATAPAMTGDAYAAVVALDAVVDTVKVDTAAILIDTAEIGAAGVGLTNLGDTRIANLNATVSSRSTLTAQQVWEYATRTLSSFGTLVADAAAAVWASVTRSLTDKAGFTISGTKTTLDALHDLATSDIPTVTAIADQVWDEAIAGHLGAGSCGTSLNAAGSAGDPWATGLPGLYGAGSAGKALSDVNTKTAALPSDPADESLLEAAITNKASRISVKIP